MSKNKQYFWLPVCFIGVLLICSCFIITDIKADSNTSPDLLGMIASEPMFWSRIGFTKNPTRLDPSGNPVFYDDDYSIEIRENAAFEQAGVTVFTSILHNGWTGVNTYNYAAVDSTLNLILKGHPERYYVPRIKLDVPIEWALQNPEDLFVSYSGPRNRDDILKLAKNMVKYWDTGGWSGNPPLEEGVVGLQSFSSRKWRKDAGVALTRLLKHIENGPYADQIVGYHIAFGSTGETTVWGTWERRKNEYKGDHGMNHQSAFYEWCIDKYGTLEALQNAWANTNLTEENFEIPFLFKPLDDKNSLEQFFLSRETDQIKVDYNFFNSQITAEAIDYFGKITKKATGGKPVGVFYGYVFTQDPNYGDHLAIDHILNSPNIDFLTSPKAYYKVNIGYPGGEQTTTLSISRKKIWIDELDNRTHLSYNQPSKTQDMDETRTVLWREVAKNLSYNNQNWWWMDLHGGWFEDSLIIDEIAKLVKISKNIREKERESISEILYVFDTNSLYFMNNSYGFNNGKGGGFINEFKTELKLTGAPVDIYRLCDLEEIPLSQYKLIVFANAFHFEKGQWERIRNRIPETATILWNYAARIRNPDFSVTNVKDVTGFAIESCSDIKTDELTGENIVQDFPIIRIIPDPDQSILDLYPDGSIMSAMKGNGRGGYIILNAYPLMTAEKLRKIAVDAGCHMYGPVNCTVYADSRFVGIFPKESIKYDMPLKNKVSVKDVISGKSWNNVEKIPVSLQAKRAMLLLMEN